MRFTLLFAALLLALTGCSGSGNGSGAAPLFSSTLPDVEGRPVALESFRGKPLIINFWARWCAPCREEIPELKRIRAERGSEGLEVVAIGIEDDREGVQRFAWAHGMDYPVLLAGNDGSALMKALGNDKLALPYTLAIDRNGNIVASKLGLLRRADLEMAAAAALEKR